MAVAAAYAIQAGASILGGLFGRRSAKKQAKAARQMADYNAKIIRANAQAEADALEFTTRRLAKQQRELQAQQRMSVASRGGTLGGTDLLSILDQAQEMQLDLLELTRQRDLATIAGENAARQTIYSGQVQSYNLRQQGNAAFAKGILGAAGTLASGFAKGDLKFPAESSMPDPFESGEFGKPFMNYPSAPEPRRSFSRGISGFRFK